MPLPSLQTTHTTSSSYQNGSPLTPVTAGGGTFHMNNYCGHLCWPVTPSGTVLLRPIGPTSRALDSRSLEIASGSRRRAVGPFLGNAVAWGGAFVREWPYPGPGRGVSCGGQGSGMEFYVSAATAPSGRRPSGRVRFRVEWALVLLALDPCIGALWVRAFPGGMFNQFQ